jgi:hypothetical protein
MICFTLTDVEGDAATAAEDGRRLVAAAQRTRAPLQIAEAIRKEGNVALFANVPPDLDTAMARYEEAIELGHEHRCAMTEGWARSGLLLAASEAGRVDANTLGTRALRFADEAHYPLLVETTLLFISHHLAMRQPGDQAAAIFGYVRHRTAPFPAWTALCERIQGAIAGLPEVDVLADRGEAMSRAEIVAYAEASLQPLGAPAVDTL